jgi:site-specific DNA-methyltransferase (adenine-specific)
MIDQLQRQILQLDKNGCFSLTFNEDYKIITKSFPDQFFDIGSVDPVYGIDGNSHRNNKSRSRATNSKEYHNALWDQQKTGDEYFTELKRVTEHQIIFGANYFPAICSTEFKTPRRHEYEQFIKDHPTNWIIWDKVNSTTGFNDCELVWVSFPVPTEVFYFMWSGMMQGKSFREGTVMNPFKEKNQKRIHPTEKPFEVYKYLLSRFAKPGYKILDTHLGSGSQRIVCYDLNLNFVGTEIDSKYYEDQENRYNWHISQLKLF